MIEIFQIIIFRCLLYWVITLKSGQNSKTQLSQVQYFEIRQKPKRVIFSHSSGGHW